MNKKQLSSTSMTVKLIENKKQINYEEKENITTIYSISSQSLNSDDSFNSSTPVKKDQKDLTDKKSQACTI